MKTFLFVTSWLLALNGFGAYQETVPSGDPNYSLGYPFLVERDYSPSVRFQQVFDESGFYRIGGQQLLITATKFYWVPGHNGGDFTLSNVEMRFSATHREPDTLSSTFAENIGANETLVHSGPLQIHGVYDIPYSTVTIPLQTPFLYDRSMGNLLLDVKNFETRDFGFIPPGHEPAFFGMNALHDQVSVVASDNVNTPSGSAFTFGLTTTFEFEIVPEPQTSLLMLAGLGVLGLVATKPWRRVLRAKGAPMGLNRRRG